MGLIVAKAALPFSFSSIDNYETCPRKYYSYSAAPKHLRVKDQDTSNIDWGNAVHDAMKNALESNGAVPLPPEMKPFQKWVDRVLAGPGELFVERKLGLTDDLSPCAYFAPVAWLRVIEDVIRIYDTVGLALDWKTGGKKDAPEQLGLAALALFQHYPQLQVVRSEYVWLRDDDTTPHVYRRSDMSAFMSALMPRVNKYVEAHRTGTFDPKPGGLCKRYCKDTTCEHHGKGNSR